MPSKYPYQSSSPYVVQFLERDGVSWTSFPDYARMMGTEKNPKWKDAKGFTIAYPFGTGQLEQAIGCIQSYRASGRGVSKHHRIIDRRSGEVVWSSADQMEAWVTTVSVTLTPQEEQMSDVDQALHIPRETLIATLQERLAEEQAKRAEADAKNAARRQTVLDAVATLSTDQVANLLMHHVWYEPDNLVQQVEQIVEDGKFVTKALEATPVESSIEKYVRVLSIANDKDIEVKPRDPIYPLL